MTATTINLSAETAIRPFVLSRTFDTSREQMWKAWTERERMMEWFGPTGSTMPVAKMDFRPGGSFHYCLETPDGNRMWGKCAYREIAAPERIVLINSFSDEDGSITRHPLSDTWPLEMHSTFTLVEEDGQTTVTVEWVPLNPAPEERQTFDSAHDGMHQGWAETFDKLEEYLATQKD